MVLCKPGNPTANTTEGDYTHLYNFLRLSGMWKVVLFGGCSSRISTSGYVESSQNVKKLCTSQLRSILHNVLKMQRSPDTLFSHIPCLQVWDLNTARVSRSLNGRRAMPIGMYVCMVITYSRVWINRVRLPILHVVS